MTDQPLREVAARIIREVRKSRQDKFDASHVGEWAYEATDQILALPPCSVPAGWRSVPEDYVRRPFADSLLPDKMVRAGIAVCDQIDEDNLNYVAGVTTDWDEGMVCVAIYRAMLSAAPQPPVQDDPGSAYAFDDRMAPVQTPPPVADGEAIRFILDDLDTLFRYLNEPGQTVNEHGLRMEETVRRVGCDLPQLRTILSAITPSNTKEG